MLLGIRTRPAPPFRRHAVVSTGGFAKRTRPPPATSDNRAPAGARPAPWCGCPHHGPPARRIEAGAGVMEYADRPQRRDPTHQKRTLELPAPGPAPSPLPSSPGPEHLKAAAIPRGGLSSSWHGRGAAPRRLPAAPASAEFDVSRDNRGQRRTRRARCDEFDVLLDGRQNRPGAQRVQRRARPASSFRRRSGRENVELAARGSSSSTLPAIVEVNVELGARGARGPPGAGRPARARPARPAGRPPRPARPAGRPPGRPPPPGPAGRRRPALRLPRATPRRAGLRRAPHRT